MKKKLVFSLLFISSYSFAQVPGYMGKKFTIGISNSISHNMNLFYFLDRFELDYKGPVISNALNMDYVYSVRRAISISVRYMSRKAESVYYSSSENKVLFSEKLNLMNYSFGIKRFSRKSIAPLGFYSKWEGYAITGWLNYKGFTTSEYNSSLNGYEKVENPGGKINFTGGGGAYSIGKQRIFKDKFVFNFLCENEKLAFNQAFFCFSANQQ